MRLPSWDRIVAAGLFTVAGGLFVWAISIEFERSPLQSRLFSRLAASMTYSVVSGESEATRFPDSGRTTSASATRGCRSSSKR